MNPNATAQMITTTQVGCGRKTFSQIAVDAVDRERKRKDGRKPIVDNAQIVQECYEAAARNDWEWFKRAFSRTPERTTWTESDALGVSKTVSRRAYPVPPHTMTNRGHLRDIG